MITREGPYFNIDWQTIILFAVIVIIGWLNIYAAIYDEYAAKNIANLDLNSGRQLVFIGLSVVAIIVIMVFDFRFFETFAWVFYVLGLAGLIFVLIFAREVNGARAWLEIGPFKLQLSEFTKISTSLALAKLVTSQNFKFSKMTDLLKSFAVILLPFALIILQKDMGTALVYASLVIVLYREGMTPIPIILGILLAIIFAITIIFQNSWVIVGIIILTVLAILIVNKTLKNIVIVMVVGALISGAVYSVDYVMMKVLKPHQRDRIELVFNPNSDPLGKGWNLTQSKIAIGSGGFSGKGYLNGTQTKFDFVPEQSTDFIFCTIGEEQGFRGSIILIALFIWLILRIIHLAERQKWRFARAYGYCVASILFFHLAINIGMTLGLFPVIGIPLPFISYGGSSLLAFTILLFIFIKFDSHRNQLLERRG